MSLLIDCSKKIITKNLKKDGYTFKSDIEEILPKFINCDFKYSYGTLRNFYFCADGSSSWGKYFTFICR